MRAIGGSVSGGVSLLAAALLYASYGFMIRESATMFGDATQTGLRMVLALLLLAGLVRWRWRKSLRATRTELLPLMGLAVAGAAIALSFTTSVRYLDLSATVLLLYVGSIATSIVVGTCVFRERLTMAKVGVIALTCVGLLLYGGGALHVGLGFVAGLCAGVCDGVANSLRKLTGHIAREKVVFYQYLFTLVPLTLYGLASHEQPIHGFHWSAIIVTVLFSVAILVSASLLQYGFGHFDLNVGTVILATELFFATLLGWLLYAEVPTISTATGSLLIFLASICTVRSPDAWWRLLRPAKQQDQLA